MFTSTDKVKNVPDKFFHKEIRSPYLGNNIKVYADLQSASHFHNGILYPVIEGIRMKRKEDILSEDNNIEVFLRCVAPNSYRITYRLHDQDKVDAMTLIMNENEFGVFADPFIL